MWVILILLMGCGKSPEGTNPGECGDAADNDNDGLADCFDPDCTGSVECGGDTDATSDEGVDVATCYDGVDNDLDEAIDCADSGCDGLFECDICSDRATAEGAFVMGTLQSVSVSFQRSYDFNQYADSLCDFAPGLCDCSASYSGTATFQSGQGSTGTFLGEWDLVETDCQEFIGVDGKPDSMARQVWYDSTAPAAYMTLRWSRDGTRLDQLVVHKDPADDFPFSEEQGIRENNQFWAACMDAVHGPVVSYTEMATVPVDDAVTIDIVDIFEFTFE